MKRILRAYFKHMSDNHVGFEYYDDKEQVVIENTLDLEHMANWIFNYMKDNK